MLHFPEERLTVSAAVHGIADVSHQFELPAFPFHGSAVLPGGKVPARIFINRQYGQAMRRANLITQMAQGLQRVGTLPQLPAVLKADGIDHKMGMQVPCIAVRCHQYFVPTPSPFRKLPCNGMGLLGSDAFRRRKGLNVMIKSSAIRLLIRSLGCHKFHKSILPVTMNATDHALASGIIQNLLFLQAVRNHALHGAHRLPGLFDVSNRCH